MRSKHVRHQILQKLAQTTEEPAEETKSLAPPPSIPGDIFSHLSEGYNGGTVALISGLTNYLNTALYYASQGKDSIQKISNNNMDLSGAASEHRNIGMISKKVYDTFLNRKNPFPKKVTGQTIHQWCDSLINMPEYNSLTQVQPTGTVAIKIQGNLKTIILNYMNAIKAQNPVNA